MKNKVFLVFVLILGFIFLIAGSPIGGLLIWGLGGILFLVLLNKQSLNEETTLKKSNKKSSKSTSVTEEKKHEDDMYIGVHLKSNEAKQVGSELQKIENKGLKKQCEKEGIPLKTIELTVAKSEKPELQAKYSLLNKNTYDYDHVYYIENGFPSLFKIMFFDYVYNQEYKNSHVYRTRVKLIFEEKHKASLIDIVRNMDSKELKKNMKAMNKKLDYPLWGRRIERKKREMFLNIFSAIDKKKLIEASKVFISENSYHKGWPDLVAVKLSNPSGITFFEVKTTDNLYTHQMFIFRRFRNKANFDMRVLKLVYN